MALAIPGSQVHRLVAHIHRYGPNPIRERKNKRTRSSDSFPEASDLAFSGFKEGKEEHGASQSPLAGGMWPRRTALAKSWA